MTNCQTYSQTWHWYVRQHYTGRRKEFMPYYILGELYNYIKNTNEQILDIGCGENNLRLFFKHITGIDHTLEADMWSWPGDTTWDNLLPYKFGVAINSLHWGDIKHNIRTCLDKCETMFITLNNNQDIDEFRQRETWEEFGEVIWFWHDDYKEDTRKQVKDYLLQDHLYNGIFSKEDVDKHVDDVYNNSIIHDPIYGVVRAIIRR